MSAIRMPSTIWGVIIFHVLIRLPYLPNCRTRNEHFILLKIGGNKPLQYSLCSTITFFCFVFWFWLNNSTDTCLFLIHISMLVITHGVCSASYRAEFYFYFTENSQAQMVQYRTVHSLESDKPLNAFQVISNKQQKHCEKRFQRWFYRQRVQST